MLATPKTSTCSIRQDDALNFIVLSLPLVRPGKFLSLLVPKTSSRTISSASTDISYGIHAIRTRMTGFNWMAGRTRLFEQQCQWIQTIEHTYPIKDAYTK